MTATRGTTNTNARGNTEDRRRRREWLVATFRADVDVLHGTSTDLANAVPVPACRCYRCGCLLTVDTVTADRIVPGCRGGTYVRSNLRPACGPCNSEVGGGLRG